MSFTKLIPLLFFLAASILLQAKPYYHRVPAKTGDSIYSLLKRYYLADYKCNYTQFYVLNDLGEKSELQAGEKYFIPVLIYDYDGKTIRSTIGIDEWKKAIRIKEYNELILAEKLRQQTIIQSRILWVPHHELHCSKEQLDANEKLRKEQPNQTTANVSQPASGGRNFPIFGKKYANVPLKDNSLKGKVFYIVGGHGGPDSGAVGSRSGHQLCEDEYAYDVALRLCRNLITHGATAYMITRDPDDGIRSANYLACDYDEYCYGNYKIPRGQKRRLFQRSDAINELYEKHKKQGVGEQIMVSVHIDSRSKGQRTDVFFYYFPNSKKGKELAKGMQSTIKAKYKRYNPSRKYSGTVTARDLHMLRETKTTGLYIELGNIRNPHDQKRFILEANRQYLADWLYAGLVGYVQP